MGHKFKSGYPPWIPGTVLGVAPDYCLDVSTQIPYLRLDTISILKQEEKHFKGFFFIQYKLIVFHIA